MDTQRKNNCKNQLCSGRHYHSQAANSQISGELDRHETGRRDLESAVQYEGG